MYGLGDIEFDRLSLFFELSENIFFLLFCKTNNYYQDKRYFYKYFKVLSKIALSIFGNFLFWSKYGVGFDIIWKNKLFTSAAFHGNFWK